MIRKGHMVIKKRPCFIIPSVFWTVREHEAKCEEEMAMQAGNEMCEDLITASIILIVSNEARWCRVETEMCERCVSHFYGNELDRE